VLVKLAEGTLENVASVGIPEALTGPIERGDVGTVRRHAAAVAGTDLRSVHEALGLLTIDIARAKGTIAHDRGEALARALAAGKETLRR